MDYDVRWEIISQAVDDRTDEEMGKIPLKKNQHVIGKSRYASVSSFLGSHGFKKDYNDVPLPKDEKSLQMLKEAGMEWDEGETNEQVEKGEGRRI